MDVAVLIIGVLGAGICLSAASHYEDAYLRGVERTRLMMYVTLGGFASFTFLSGVAFLQLID
jgi:hypothetical protein